MTPEHAVTSDYTPLSTLSLRDLRVELLQRAAATAARARTSRAKGDLRTARQLESRAKELIRVARSVDVT